MAKLQRITVTGADDSVDPAQVVELVSQYPLAEVGVLLRDYDGCSLGGPRFPSHGWIMELQRAVGAAKQPVCLSGHLCGELVSNFLTSSDPEVPYVHMWKRVQINTHGNYHAVKLRHLRRNLSIMRSLGVQVIFQGDGANEEVFEWAHQCLSCAQADVAILFDISHGAGKTPETWREPIQNAYCGYAGGLSPENVVTQLELINETVNHVINLGVGYRGRLHQPGSVSRGCYWIDAETMLRSKDDLKFDVLKADAFLRKASEFAHGKAG